VQHERVVPARHVISTVRGIVAKIIDRRTEHCWILRLPEKQRRHPTSQKKCSEGGCVFVWAADDVSNK